LNEETGAPIHARKRVDRERRSVERPRAKGRLSRPPGSLRGAHERLKPAWKRRWRVDARIGAHEVSQVGSGDQCDGRAAYPAGQPIGASSSSRQHRAQRIGKLDGG
jgi:hypothetical protein